MIDINDLRSNPKRYKEAALKKNIEFDIEKFLELDLELRRAKQEYENLRAAQNKISREISSSSGKDKELRLEEAKRLAHEVQEASLKLKHLEDAWLNQILLCPNPPLDSVPLGRNEDDNVEIRRWGDPSKLSLDHKEILTKLGCLDLEAGSNVSGAKFYFLRGPLALLHHAILQYGIQFLTRKGFELIEPPHIVSDFAMTGTGYFPLGKDQTYELSDNGSRKYLIGTSEVPLCAMYAGKILDEENLPIKLAGYSACYRKEAGSYGRETAGLYRVHQFYKVEQVVICNPDPCESERMHDYLLANSEEFVRSLEIPYRVVQICTGDLGLGQVLKHDIECWMPSRNGYGETHSCSSLYAFQARRLNIKVRAGKKQTFPFTLNNTLVASPRILIAYFENHYNPDQRKVFLVPPLRKYFEDQDYLSF
ncbi:MAG: serine--tRNA ligase [Deltaproteobacteria bacterium]|nr:serine--tRNA ligase [Deltaproteobacteria bacterium]